MFPYVSITGSITVEVTVTVVPYWGNVTTVHAWFYSSIIFHQLIFDKSANPRFLLLLRTSSSTSSYLNNQRYASKLWLMLSSKYAPVLQFLNSLCFISTRIELNFISTWNIITLWKKLLHFAFSTRNFWF